MIEISAGDLTLKVSEVGAALAEVWLGQTQIVGRPDVYSGVVLYPWPNRITDGIWHWQGRTLQLPLNDSEQDSALHGLVFDKKFEVLQKKETSVCLNYELESSVGFPFRSRISASYAIVANAIEAKIEVANLGGDQLPFAIGIHPYFVADEGSTVAFENNLIAVSDTHLDDSFSNDTESIQIETKEFVVSIQSTGLPVTHIFTNRYSSRDVLWLAVESQSAEKDSLKDSETTLVLEPGSTQEFVYSLVPTLKA